ncbi:hypothetical protein EVAR_9008_1 [Eumeta japonica]|uniref:Uncharacterized protein n=1 Tax=Eumeta variegata TaxID=151549 RepID=A0A4C1WPM0_EUMVA|nr:hypothetical protein EVAR_9008_1 [Eumeta japonica]
MDTTACEHSQPQNSHQCISGFLGGIGYLIEGGVGHRNSPSLDDTLQPKQLHGCYFAYVFRESVVFHRLNRPFHVVQLRKINPAGNTLPPACVASVAAHKQIVKAGSVRPHESASVGCQPGSFSEVATRLGRTLRGASEGNEALRASRRRSGAETTRLFIAV